MNYKAIFDKIVSAANEISDKLNAVNEFINDLYDEKQYLPSAPNYQETIKILSPKEDEYSLLEQVNYLSYLEMADSVSAFSKYVAENYEMYNEDFDKFIDNSLPYISNIYRSISSTLKKNRKIKPKFNNQKYTARAYTVSFIAKLFSNADSLYEMDGGFLPDVSILLDMMLVISDKVSGADGAFVELVKSKSKVISDGEEIFMKMIEENPEHPRFLEVFGKWMALCIEYAFDFSEAFKNISRTIDNFT